LKKLNNLVGLSQANKLLIRAGKTWLKKYLGII